MAHEASGPIEEAVSSYRSADAFFAAPYVDIDERRDSPIPHRYVHGGFATTATRFSFYFPDSYEGRFFHFLEGGYGGNENTASVRGSQFGGLAFAASRGGFFVESNQGHVGAEPCPKAGDDATVYGYRASAECARFARHLAGSVYGEAPRHGYLFGGSGGGHRTLLAMEYVEDDVWDGGVASVIGAPNTMRAYSAMNNARRLIGPRFAQVIDAIEPGGSSNPFEHLDTEQREALAHLYGEGFPRRAERSVLEGLNAGVAFWTWNADGLRHVHGEYFDAFWSAPGHAGADGLVRDWLLTLRTTVTKTVTPDEAAGYPVSGFGRMLMMAPRDKRVGVTVAADLPDWVEGAKITVLTGAAAGRVLYCSNFADGLIIGSSIGEAQTLLFDGVEPGDEIEIDNREFLAYCYYYRHHVVSLRGSRRLFVDGQPIYPQYEDPPMSSSPVFGTVPRHDTVRRPTFLLQHSLDTSGWPAGAVECEERIRAHLGDRADERFRLWWVENAEHIPGSQVPARSRPAPSTRLIDYAGAHEAALDAMVALIERSVPPPSSTGYAFDWDDGAVRLAADAAGRGGIQPVAVASANGSICARVHPGQEVVLSVVAEAPKGAGSIVEVAWNFEGDGEWPEVYRPQPADPILHHETRHVFHRPGTYFASARVIAHATGDADDPFARVMNLGRCRVVVE